MDAGWIRESQTLLSLKKLIVGFFRRRIPWLGRTCLRCLVFSVGVVETTDGVFVESGQCWFGEREKMEW
jgi:hypothetical protein